MADCRLKKTKSRIVTLQLHRFFASPSKVLRVARASRPLSQERARAGCPRDTAEATTSIFINLGGPQAHVHSE
jgi:hypothetical protein